MKPHTTPPKRSVHKCSWTAEEDEALLKLVEQHGPKKWSVIASSLTGRIGKQCRERWHNHLNPDVRKDAWTPEEDELIFELVEQMGTKWATIAKHLNGRTDNSIKNRYYSSLKKLHEKRKADGNTGAAAGKKAVIPKRNRAKVQAQQVLPMPPGLTTSPPQQAEVSRKRRRSTDSTSSFVCDSDSSLDTDGPSPSPFISTSPCIVPSAHAVKHGQGPRSPTQEDFARIANLARTGKLNMDNLQEVCAKMGMRVQVLDANEADEMIKAEGYLTMPVPVAKKAKVAGAGNRHSRKPTKTEAGIEQDEVDFNQQVVEEPLIDPHTITLPTEEFAFPVVGDGFARTGEPTTQAGFGDVPWFPNAFADPFGNLLLDNQQQPSLAYVPDTKPQTFETGLDDLPPLSLVSEYNSMLHVPHQP